MIYEEEMEVLSKHFKCEECHENGCHDTDVHQMKLLEAAAGIYEKGFKAAINKIIVGGPVEVYEMKQKLLKVLGL